jgi:hypothetical protein
MKSKTSRLIIEFPSQRSLNSFVERIELEKDPIHQGGIHKLKAYKADVFDFGGTVPATKKYDWFILRSEGDRP